MDVNQAHEGGWHGSLGERRPYLAARAAGSFFYEVITLLFTHSNSCLLVCSALLWYTTVPYTPLYPLLNPLTHFSRLGSPSSQLAGALLLATVLCLD